MFVGHLAAGLVLKARVREAPLSWLLWATVAPDLLCGVLVILGVEQVVVEGTLVFGHLRSDIGYSHALSASIACALIAGAVAARASRSRRVGAALGLALLSHFVLDALTHRHDMPLLGFDASHDLRLGTNLALHPWGMFALELLGCLYAWWVFDRKNRRLLGTLATLLVLYTNSLFGFWALPTPSVATLGGAMFASFVVATLVVLWAGRASAAVLPARRPRGVGAQTAA